MKKTFNTGKILIFLLLIISCGKEKPKNKLISPQENIKLTNNSKYISENKIDTLNQLEAFIKIKGLNFIATNKGISIINKKNELIKSYRLNYENYDLKLLNVKFKTNSNKTKLLIITSSGQSSTALIIQLNLNTLKLDWINEFSRQIVSACYSNNSNIIAFGTGYSKKQRNLPIYHSSLFTINSTTGEFIQYYEQGESVRKVEFSKNDQLLYVVLDWPHVDTYVWETNNTQKRKGTFGKDGNPYYDINTINKQEFITIGKNGISKWDLSNPDKYELLYNEYINAGNKIFKVNGKENLMIDYFEGTSNPPLIRYLNSDFKSTNSFSLKNDFSNVVLSESKLNGINRDENSIISFDIEKKNIEFNIKLDSLKIKTTANTVYRKSLILGLKTK